MNAKVRLTVEAEADLVRLYEFVLAREDDDLTLADKALTAITVAFESLALTPFTCRKAQPDNPFLRELIIPFGATGYVALFEITNSDWITVIAVRHQRESDYH